MNIKKKGCANSANNMHIMILNQILQFSAVYDILYHLSYKKTVKQDVILIRAAAFFCKGVGHLPPTVMFSDPRRSMMKSRKKLSSGRYWLSKQRPCRA